MFTRFRFCGKHIRSRLHRQAVANLSRAIVVISTTAFPLSQIAQPGTPSSVKDVNAIRVISLNPSNYKWSVMISGNDVTGWQTLSLNPCPPGVFGSDTNLYVMVNDNVEIDQADGTGNCIPGSEGTIHFMISGRYVNPTVGSSSSGIYEGIVDAESSGRVMPGSMAFNWGVKLQPTNPPQSVYYGVYAPITVSEGIADIDGSGVNVDVETPSFAFYVPSGGELKLHGFRVATKTTMNGAAVTEIACSSNITTIATKLNPIVGSYVDIQWTDNTHFWGVHGPVVTSSASSFTLSDNRCGWAGRPGPGTITRSASLGNVAPVHAFILDNGQNLDVSEIYFHNPAWAFRKFLNNGIVVWNDQAFHAENVVVLGGGFNCGVNYCGQAIYAPGGQVGGGSMAAVGWLRGLNLSLQCSGNGINWLSGNSVDVTDAVIQGHSQFELQVGNMRGNYAGAAATFIYGEATGCPNPFYTAAGLSGLAAASQAGIIALGNDVTLDPGPVGPRGRFPNFASGGKTTYTYYVVIHDGPNVTAPLPFGNATPGAGSFTVAWPRYASRTGNPVTYDILKVASSRGQRNAPLLNGKSQQIGLAAGVAQCSALICTLTDIGGELSNYAPSSSIVSLDPFLWNWPGDIVMSKSGRLFSDVGVYGGLAGTVTTRPDHQTVFAKICDQDSPNIYVSCLAADNGSTLLPNTTNFGGGATDLKGRLIFSGAYTTAPVVGSVVTIHDSNPAATLADPFHRPKADPDDSWIGLDFVSSLSKVGLAIGSPTSVDICLNQIPSTCSARAQERLTSSAKIFSVPVRVPAGTEGLPSLVFDAGPGWFAPTTACSAMTTASTERVRICDNKLTFSSSAAFQWTSNGSSSGNVDTVLSRISPGVLEINSGTGTGGNGSLLATNYKIPLTATSALKGGQPVKADKGNANHIDKTVHTDTSAGIVIGVVVNSPSAGAVAQVVTSGVVSMTFDTNGRGNCEIGNWVIVGTITDGDVECAKTYPPPGTIIGVAMQSQTTTHAPFSVMVGLR